MRLPNKPYCYKYSTFCLLIGFSLYAIFLFILITGISDKEKLFDISFGKMGEGPLILILSFGTLGFIYGLIKDIKEIKRYKLSYIKYFDLQFPAKPFSFRYFIIIWSIGILFLIFIAIILNILYYLHPEDELLNLYVKYGRLLFIIFVIISILALICGLIIDYKYYKNSQFENIFKYLLECRKKNTSINIFRK